MFSFTLRPLLPAAFATLLLLPGCCECALDGPFSTIELRFSADSIGGTGFTRAEVQSAYVIRYADPNLTAPLDTLRQLPATPANPAQLPFEVQYNKLGEEFSFWLQGQYGAVGADNSFRVVVPAAGRSYDVTDIDVKVSTSQVSLCKCGQLDRLKLKINGQQADARKEVPKLTR